MTNSGSGYPVVVFLHGFGMLGNDYSRIGELLASEGKETTSLNIDGANRYPG